MIDLMEQCRNNAPLIMGVVNVTPDSFSDGGHYLGAEEAINHGVKLLEQGADILDIGGESTRPGADTVSIEEEVSRVIPVIKGLEGKAKFISIDTRNAQTMQAAIYAGANIINDVSGLTHDPKSIEVAAKSNLPVCIMHMQGTPETMQTKPEYDDILAEIENFFAERIKTCNAAGIKKIILDPGIGFGKTLQHNLKILNNLNRFKKLGCPILLGVSRKSFIDKLCSIPNPERRIPGTIAATLSGLEQGVEIHRVHDVSEVKQAVDVYQAIRSAGS